MPTPYTYSIQNDFPQSTVNSDLLTVEINNAAITPILESVGTAGDVCTVWFSSALSGPEETTLDAVVAAHLPIGAPPSVVDLQNATIVDGSWAVFRDYLDGTLASLYFYLQTYDDQYVITTEPLGGFRHRYTLPFTDSADKTDFDTNFLPIQATRIPADQIGIAAKDSTITYLGNGNIDKIDTIIGDKTQTDQFSYTIDGDIQSIVRTYT